jgi:hypothetical protein
MAIVGMVIVEIFGGRGSCMEELPIIVVSMQCRGRTDIRWDRIVGDEAMPPIM